MRAGSAIQVARAGRISVWARTAVVSCSRPGRTCEVQSGQPSGAVMTWMLPPWLACLPDHHRSTPVVGPGVRHRSVSIRVPSMVTWLVPGGLRGQQRRCRLGASGGERIDTLVQVVVAGGSADRVVEGQLRHPGAVEKPAQHQHRLREGAQRPSAGTGTTPARSASSRPAQHTPRCCSRAGSVAVYVTLIRRRTPMKLIFGRTNFHTGVLRLFVAPQHVRRVAAIVTHRHRPLRGMAQ